jgi:hypothetical protein
MDVEVSLVDEVADKSVVEPSFTSIASQGFTIKKFLKGCFVALGGVSGLVTIGSVFNVNSGLLIWSITVVLGIFVLWGILSYCVVMQGIKDDEIKRMSNAATRLQNTVLHKRASSASTVKNRKKRERNKGK